MLRACLNRVFGVTIGNQVSRLIFCLIPNIKLESTSKILALTESEENDEPKSETSIFDFNTTNCLKLVELSLMAAKCASNIFLFGSLVHWSWSCGSGKDDTFFAGCVRASFGGYLATLLIDHNLTYWGLLYFYGEPMIRK